MREIMEAIGISLMSVNYHLGYEKVLCKIDASLTHN